VKEQLTLGEDGLPLGWGEQEICFEAMFDLRRMVALRYDGTDPFPSEWLNDRPAFLTFHEAVPDEGVEKGYIALQTERASNRNHREDVIFFGVRNKVREGADWPAVEAFIRERLESKNVDLQCKVGKAYLSSLLWLAASGSEWADRRRELGIDA
jgi:hypothetical protein